MQDSFQLPSNDNDNWLMYPGGKIEPACQLTESALHFSGMYLTRTVLMMMTMMITLIVFTLLYMMILQLSAGGKIELACQQNGAVLLFNGMSLTRSVLMMTMTMTLI